MKPVPPSIKNKPDVLLYSKDYNVIMFMLT